VVLSRIAGWMTTIFCRKLRLCVPYGFYVIYLWSKERKLLYILRLCVPYGFYVILYLWSKERKLLYILRLCVHCWFYIYVIGFELKNLIS